MKPVYLKSNETRMAAAEREIRFLKRRSQTPEPDEYGTASGIQFEIMNVGGWLSIETTSTADGLPTGDGIRLDADEGDITINAAADDVNLVSGDDIEMTGGQDIILTANRDVQVNADRDILLECVSGLIFLHGLPTSDPASTGALWNDGGTLKIS